MTLLLLKMKLLLLKIKLKSTDDRAWWPVKAPLGAIDNQLRSNNMSDYEEARIAWMEDNNGSTIGFAEAYGPKSNCLRISCRPGS